MDSPIVCTYIKQSMYAEIPVEILIRQIRGPKDLFKIQSGGILVPNEPRNSSAEYECTVTVGGGKLTVAQKSFYAIFTSKLMLLSVYHLCRSNRT